VICLFVCLILLHWSRKGVIYVFARGIIRKTWYCLLSRQVSNWKTHKLYEFKIRHNGFNIFICLVGFSQLCRLSFMFCLIGFLNSIRVFRSIYIIMLCLQWLCQYSGHGWRHSAPPEGECTMSSALTTICYMLYVRCRQNILKTITIKDVLILLTNILYQIVLKVWEYFLLHLRL
jgi:hypothetical protein